MMTPEQRNKLVVGLAILLLFLIATAPRDANGGHQKPAGYTDGEGKDKPAHKHTKYFDLVDDSHLNASLKEFLRTHSVGSNQSTYVPRNITKVPYYTGYWTAAPPNSGLRGANWNRSVIGLKRPPSLYRHNTEGVFYLGQLKSVTHAKGPDVIYEGSLAIRDGVYSTDRSKEFSLRGTYAWERGLLLAVGCDLDANPYELPLVHFNASRNRSSGSATKAVGSSNNNNELVRTFFEGKDVVFDALRGQVVNKVCPLKVALAFHTTRNISQLSLGDIKKEVADYNNNKLISMEGFVFSNYHKQMLTLSGYIYSTHERRVEALCYLLYEAFAVSMDFMFSFRQSKAISSLALASRVSVKTIGFQSVIDIFLSVGHFVLAISFCKKNTTTTDSHTHTHTLIYIYIY